MSLLGALIESYLDRTELPGEEQARWQLTLPWPFIPLSCGSVSWAPFTHIRLYFHTLSSPQPTHIDRCAHSQR